MLLSPAFSLLELQCKDILNTKLSITRGLVYACQYADQPTLFIKKEGAKYGPF